MKVRNGFVSNSSSSSFIIGYKGEFHKTVPPMLEKILKDNDLYSMHNLKMLTAKVQEDTYESLTEYKRRLVNKLTDEADYWYSNITPFVLKNREEWEKEDPKSYQEHVDYIESIRQNPILVAEKIIQEKVSDNSWSVNGQMLSVIDFLKEGYKVCVFDLEYSGDFADETKYPYYRELHVLTHELVHKLADEYQKPLIDTDNFKLERIC